MKNTRTLDYYEQNSEQFIHDTVSANMSETCGFFLSAIKEEHPLEDNSELKIMDFGCGSGRDARQFQLLGFQVEALDGSLELVKAARQLTGINVRHMRFEAFHEVVAYDGIWACASILHLTKEELPAVFHSLSAALKNHGILYASFKYGNFEGYRNGRYYTDFTEHAFSQLLEGIVSLEITKMWVTSDVRPGRADEKWLNLLIRKKNH